MAKIVTYDLCKPETSADYKELIDRIKQYTHCKLMESCWLISTSWTCAQVREDLSQHIDSNDRLFVANLTGEASWIGKMLSSTDDIKKILNE